MAEKEYIEREALQNKAFGENHPTFYDGQDIADWYEKCINETAAADVAPVRHGYFRRLTFSGDIIICSECKMAYNIFETNGAENFNYCPNCGAKMGGKERDEND